MFVNFYYPRSRQRCAATIVFEMGRKTIGSSDSFHCLIRALIRALACLTAGASACTLCGVGTYSVNHPSFNISGATCQPQLNQDYFDRNTLVNGYPSYHSADNSVFVWSYEASSWLVGALSSVGNSSLWAYASCLTSGCPISSAVSWAEYCAASNQETADLSFLPGPSAGQPSPGL